MKGKIFILTAALTLAWGFAAQAMKIIDPPPQRKPIAEWRRVQQVHFFHEGKRQQLFGDAGRAAFCFRVALWADPCCDACYYELSALYVSQGKYKEAAIAATNAYGIDTANYWYALHRAKLLFATGDFETAERLYWRCLAQKPRQPELYEELLDMYTALNDFDKSLALIDYYEQYFGQDATSISTRQQLYYKMGNLAGSAEQATLLADKYPNTLRHCLVAAELCMQQGQDSLAWEYLRRAGQLDSVSVEYQMSVADYYRRSERFGEYFEVLQKAFANPQANLQMKLYTLEFLQQFPQFTNLFSLEMSGLYSILQTDSGGSYAGDWLYVQFLLQNRHFDEAETSMRLALGRLFENPPTAKPDLQAMQKINATLLTLLAERRQWDSVIAASERYAGQMDDRYVSHYFKAFALLQKHDYPAAKRAAETAVGYVEAADSGSFAQVYATLGDICFNLKEFSQSDKFYEKALKYAPRNALLYNNYAYYLSLRGAKLKKALKMSAYALEQSPNNPTYLDTYAWILYKQRRYEEARQIFHRAIAYHGDKEYTILEHYGDVLWQLGEKDNALIYWKRSLENGNPNPELPKKISGN